MPVGALVDAEEAPLDCNLNVKGLTLFLFAIYLGTRLMICFSLYISSVHSRWKPVGFCLKHHTLPKPCTTWLESSHNFFICENCQHSQSFTRHSLFLAIGFHSTASRNYNLTGQGITFLLLPIQIKAKSSRQLDEKKNLIFKELGNLVFKIPACSSFLLWLYSTQQIKFSLIFCHSLWNPWSRY